MAGEFTTAVYVIAGIGFIVGGAFALPPLTEPESADLPPQARGVGVQQELSYCRNNRLAVNCHCFAQKAGQILANDEPRALRTNYIDQTELARAQAMDSC